MTDDEFEKRIEKKLTPPFTVGEYKDIRLRVYLDKKATDKGELLGESFKLATGVSLQINESYREFQDRPHWESGKIWFSPLKENKITNIVSIKQLIEYFQNEIIKYRKEEIDQLPLTQIEYWMDCIENLIKELWIIRIDDKCLMKY